MPWNRWRIFYTVCCRERDFACMKNLLYAIIYSVCKAANMTAEAEDKLYRQEAVIF